MPVSERSIGWIATDRRGRCSGGLTISNGLGWSPDGGTMYLVDSGPRVVHAFKFDAERGTISDDRVLVTVAEEIGAPDGMTVDADGGCRRWMPTVKLPDYHGREPKVPQHIRAPRYGPVGRRGRDSNGPGHPAGDRDGRVFAAS
jgi:hypothetical protein